jgi:hypothetical protein
MNLQNPLFMRNTKITLAAMMLALVCRFFGFAGSPPVVATVGGGGKAAFEVPDNGAIAHFTVGASVKVDGSAKGNSSTFITGSFTVVVTAMNGSLNSDGTVTLSGPSALVLPDGVQIPIPFIITVHAGGPGEGWIDIYHPTVAQPWGYHDLEVVTTGRISINSP